MSSIESLIDNLKGNDNVKASDNFNSIMADKLKDALDAKKNRLSINNDRSSF